MKQRAEGSVKTGALSKDEKKYIEKWMNMKSDHELGAYLRRAPIQVEKHRRAHLEANSGLSVKAKDRAVAIEELHSRHDWDCFKKEFTKEELMIFENSYAEMMAQFKEVNYTETEQIYGYIRTKILLQRHGIERMQAQKQIERLEKLLNAEYNKGETYANKHGNSIMNLEQELAALRNASTSKTKEYKDLMDKSQALMKDLKGTREQRIKKAEDARHNVMGLMKFLEEEENRQAVGTELLLMEAATVQERERLTDYHTYSDGGIDKPILSPESS